MALALSSHKKKGLIVLFAAYLLAALTSGPVTGYSAAMLYDGFLHPSKMGWVWAYPFLAFPWLLFLFAGLFLYLMEDGRNERALFILLLGYVTLFQLPHPWILELMMLTPK